LRKPQIFLNTLLRVRILPYLYSYLSSHTHIIPKCTQTEPNWNSKKQKLCPDSCSISEHIVEAGSLIGCLNRSIILIGCKVKKHLLVTSPEARLLHIIDSYIIDGRSTTRRLYSCCCWRHCSCWRHGSYRIPFGTLLPAVAVLVIFVLSLLLLLALLLLLLLLATLESSLYPSC